MGYDFPSDRVHKIALKKAITKHDKNKPKHNQANGLAGAIAIAQHNEGIFTITSGRGRY